MTEPSSDDQGVDAGSNQADSADSAASGVPSPNPEVAQLEAEIERRREDLAHTVDLLTAKLDVKTRTKERAVEVKQQATERVQHLRNRATDDQGKPTSTAISIAGGVALGVVALTALAVWRRRGSRRR